MTLPAKKQIRFGPAYRAEKIGRTELHQAKIEKGRVFSIIATDVRVAMLHERLGERGCCFMVLRAGAGMTFQQMIEFLDGQKMAKNYWPERLEVVTELPRTPSGKIQKFKLREIASTFSQ